MSVRALLLAFVLAACAGTTAAPRPAAAQQPEPARLLARADSAFAAGDSAAARAAYRQLLALTPDHSRAHYQLAMLAPRGSRERIDLLRRYTQLEPDDAWGFLALGDAWRDAGEPVEARAAYGRALALEPDEPEFRRGLAALAAAPTRAAFSIEPRASAASDSDGSTLLRTGAAAGLRTRTGALLGIDAARVAAADEATHVAGWDAALTGEWRPRRELLLSARAGILHVPERTDAAAVREPVLHARARWRPSDGPALELRARHEPVTATPQLLALPLVLSEARATLELPIHARLYARGVGRRGRLHTPDDVNTRTLIGAGPVLRLRPALELNALVARSGYAHASPGGYFAPERVDAIDLGVYWEHEAERLLVAVDAGAGAERVTGFEAPAGDWARALRLWSQLALSLTPRSTLNLELEAYDTRAGEALVATGTSWRWASLTLSLNLNLSLSP